MCIKHASPLICTSALLSPAVCSRSLLSCTLHAQCAHQQLELRLALLPAQRTAIFCLQAAAANVLHTGAAAAGQLPNVRAASNDGVQPVHACDHACSHAAGQSTLGAAHAESNAAGTSLDGVSSVLNAPADDASQEQHLCAEVHGACGQPQVELVVLTALDTPEAATTAKTLNRLKATACAALANQHAGVLAFACPP